MRSIPPWLALVFILLFAFATRIYRLAIPSRYVFDEVYHAVTVKLIARNDVRAYEWWNPPIEPNTAVDWLHPPLAKYTQALSVKVFGENSFGWRFSSAIFGVGVIGLVYWLSLLAFRKQSLSLLAAFLATLDGLLLVQSRVAMNDIHVTFFILLTLIMYFRYREKHSAGRLLATGVAAGLAVGSKWSGVFVIATIGLVEAVELLKTIVIQKAITSVIVKRATLTLLSLLIVPALLYVLSYTHMFLQGKTLDHFYKLHQQIWWYQTNLKATHTYQSRPWQWFFDLRPVWFYVDYTNPTTTANIYTFGNPLLFWSGGIAVLTTALYLIQKGSKRALSKINTHLLIILFAYGMVWLPWTLSPRIMFFYHYTPAVPLLSILLAYWLYQAWHTKQKSNQRLNRTAVVTIVSLIALVFVVWYPQWTAIPVSKAFAQAVYYRIPSWK